MQAVNPEHLEQFVFEVERRICDCVHYQPFDEGPVWLVPHKPLEEVMLDARVPLALWKRVAEQVHCPGCGQSHGLWEEVGVKTDAQLRFDGLVAEWGDEYCCRLEDFYSFLKQHPDKGLDHQVGREIDDNLSKFTVTTIENEIWYRAREAKDDREPSPADFYLKGNYPGRFHREGERVLYLAQHEDTAGREATEKDEVNVWVQKFRIERLERVVDLASTEGWDEDGFPVIIIGLERWGAVERPVADRKKPEIPSYLVPRFIADCARKQGFSGIRFPSSRGCFANLVVLQVDAPIRPEGQPRMIRVEKRRPAFPLPDVPPEWWFIKDD